jgi:hypothetical protein
MPAATLLQMMSTNFAVRVLDDRGHPAVGRRVRADFGLLHGHTDAFTDDEGWALIQATGDYVSATISIDYTIVGDVSYPDGKTFSFTQP